MYGFPGFVEWMKNEVPGLQTGRIQASEKPSVQLDRILYQWITGKRVAYSKVLKDLIPQQDEVWEFKTADLRIFGWIYRPRIFIAAFGDYTDYYKPPNPKRSYEQAKRSVLEARDKIDLDEPKFTGGVFDDLVRV